MVKSEERHCNDAQSTKLHQYGYSISSRTTRFYEPIAPLAAAACCWIAQYNWFFPFLCQRPDDACSVAPVHRLPKNRCSRSHTGGKLLARIAKALLLTAENDLQRRPQQSHGYRHQGLTRPIVCSLWTPQMTTSHLAESSADLLFFSDFYDLWSLVELLIDIQL